jgi:hypothetical protein
MSFFLLFIQIDDKVIGAILKASVSTLSIGAENPFRISFTLAPNFSTFLTSKPREYN